MSALVAIQVYGLNSACVSMVSVEQTFLVWPIHDVLLHYKTLFEQCRIARHFNLL